MITHQRRTMEMADVLFGVSMQGDGVTKVISQKLDQALQARGVGNMGWLTGAVGRLTAVLLQGVLGQRVFLRLLKRGQLGYHLSEEI